MNDRAEIEWAPRISLAKIRELYSAESRGTLSDKLLQEVGFGLFARCASILEFTEAIDGRVKCKRCARAGKTIIIERKTKKPDEIMRCPSCAWQVRWRVFVSESEKLDGQLSAGNAGNAFRRYTAFYPQCRSAEERMLAIDRLIHEFHWNLVRGFAEPQATRPAAANLIECGGLREVVAFLDELSGRTAEAPVV